SRRDRNSRCGARLSRARCDRQRPGLRSVGAEQTAMDYAVWANRSAPYTRLVTEAAGVVAALAAVGALFFAWRTVTEARGAHLEARRDRQLARIEALGER